MKVGVMQPYLFPYLGYYQLVYCVDFFVLYDDVNYKRNSYINKNNILVNNLKYKFIAPVIDASQNKKIKDLSFSNDIEKILITITQSYSKAPYFKNIYPLIESVFLSKNRSVTHVCEKSISLVFDYLDVNKKIIKSSDLIYDLNMSAADKLIKITKLFNGNNYINSIGGKELYDKNFFKRSGINLSFIKSDFFSYKQANNKFISNLSMIDVLMWCSKEEINHLLKKYTLL